MVFTKAKTMSKLLFCLLVAVASAQQWEDYETDSADYSESSDLDSGLWREEAVLLTPQDRERESTR